MRIHTDKLTADDLPRNRPARTLIELTAHGSRKRSHAFKVKMVGEPGKDAHGITRRDHRELRGRARLHQPDHRPEL